MAARVAPGLSAVAQATVRICDAKGERRGQGLWIVQPGGASLILTCYHVVADIDDKSAIAVVPFSAGDEPQQRFSARYSAERSDPGGDLAVLTVDANVAAPVPAPAFLPLAPSYRKREDVVGVVRPTGTSSHRFNARLAEATRLSLSIGDVDATIARAWRLIDTTDVRNGISGAPVVLRDGVVGLAHFARAETADYAREAYVVPIENWFAKNPELAESAGERGPADTAPPVPPHFVPRPDVLAELHAAVAAGANGPGIAMTALHGMAGLGKSVMAQAFCEACRAAQTFPHGIMWLHLGKEPAYDVRTRLREIGKCIGDDLRSYDTELGAVNRYKTVMHDKAMLIVLDDVWNVHDVEPFRAHAPRSRLLFTTRDDSIATSVSARVVQPGPLSAAQSRDLLAGWSGLPEDALPAEAERLVSECGGLALALSITGAMLHGKPKPHWRYVLHLLETADLDKLRQAFLGYPYPSVLRALQVSVDELDAETSLRYHALAVTLEDTVIDPVMQRTLWNADEFGALETAETLVRLALAGRAADGGIQLHDLLLDYVRHHYPVREALELIHDAMRLSSHVFAKEPSQFASQLVGRLLPHAPARGIREFAGSIIVAAVRPWMRPLNAALQPPGTSLIRTFEGHGSDVNAVAVTPDGRRAVSASKDKTLKVWDVERGLAEMTLTGHRDSVAAVAMTGDGMHVVSASWDGTCRTWELGTGNPTGTLSGHSSAVNGVAVTPDGGTAVSASQDRTLAVWDLHEGRLLQRLGGRGDAFTSVALMPDGRHAVAASWDQSLSVWDLQTGEFVRTLGVHASWISAVAVSADGRRAVSAAYDDTLKVWDLESASPIRTLEGHTAAVNAVAVTGDGTRAVSGSDDKTVKVWEIETGLCVETLAGHAGGVRGVALVPNSRGVLSASDDRTLKLWRLGNTTPFTPSETHRAAIAAIAVTPNGARAVSASRDHTLIVWDLPLGRAVRTLEGHTDAVVAVAVTADGLHAVSASDDRTLKVWELDTGRIVRTLRGHAIAVTVLAVSPDATRAVSASRDVMIAPGSGLTLNAPMHVWDLVDGRVVRSLDGHYDPVHSIAVSGDGLQAVSAAANGPVIVWDLQSGSIIDTVPAIAMSSDGACAISIAPGGVLNVWNVATRASHRTPGFAGSRTALAVAPGGRRTVSISEGMTLEVWDADHPGTVTTFSCDAAVECCAFAGDGIVVAGDRAGRFYVLAFEP